MEDKVPELRFLDSENDFRVADVLAFVNHPGEGARQNKVRTSRGKYLTVETPDGMQLWCQLDPEEETSIEEVNLHYKTATRCKIVLDGWSKQSLNGRFGLAYVWNKNGDTEFPMNLNVVNAGMFADDEAGEFTAQIAAFGHDVSLYPDEATYSEHKRQFAPESFIPAGTFCIYEDEPDWEPTTQAIISGKIEHVSKQKVAYTGEEYYHLLVSCLGLKLDVPLAVEDVKEAPVAGGYINGVFYLTARLFRSLNDECLTPRLTIDTKEIIEDWKSLKLTEDYEESCEGWTLFTYPIMPDKSILVIFQNTSEANNDAPEESVTYYRSLRFDQNGQIIERRRLRLIGEQLNTL